MHVSKSIQCLYLLPVQALPVHVMDVSHIRFNPWGAADFHQNFNGQK